MLNCSKSKDKRPSPKGSRASIKSYAQCLAQKKCLGHLLLNEFVYLCHLFPRARSIERGGRWSSFKTEILLLSLNKQKE